MLDREKKTGLFRTTRVIKKEMYSSFKGQQQNKLELNN